MMPAPLRGFNRVALGLEVRRVLRNHRTLVIILGFPASFFLLFGLPYRSQHPGDAGTLAYVMVSMAVYGAMVGTTTCGAAVAVERGQGWSRQLRLTPLRPTGYVAMKVATAMVLGFIAVAVEFGLGAASGVRLAPQVWLLSGLAAWLCSLVFAAAGVFVGFLLPSENVMQFVGPLLALLAMLGGLFVPVSLLPHTIQEVARLTPVYGVGALARAPLGGGVTLPAVASVVLWAAVFITGAAWLFRRDTAR
jgi:ABC-2 type transport system permease protein